MTFLKMLAHNVFGTCRNFLLTYHSSLHEHISLIALANVCR